MAPPTKTIVENNYRDQREKILTRRKILQMLLGL